MELLLVKTKCFLQIMIVHYETAIDYQKQGVNVQAIVDVRTETNGHYTKKYQRTWNNYFKWI